MARCPAHDDREPSLSIRSEPGRVLFYCFAGCPTEDVVAAIGLTMRDLFDGMPRLQQTFDPTAQLRMRAAAGLEAWRQVQLTAACALLRRLDSLVARTASILAVWADSGVVEGEQVDLAWNRLAFLYREGQVLDWDFARLTRPDARAHLAVWREHTGRADVS